MSSKKTSAASNASAGQPRIALSMAQLLRDMGVEEHDPKVVNQLLEFMNRYVVETLQDAQDYQRHANRSKLTEQDVQLALKTNLETSFAPPPPRDVVAGLARQCNSVPLPVLPNRAGVLLPAPDQCLLRVNYQVGSEPKEGRGDD